MKKIIKNETGRLNILLAILIIIAIAITVLINVLTTALSDRYPLSADLTANAAYDLGSSSKEILEALTDDVDIYVLSSRGSFTGDKYLVQTRTLLEKYPQYSPHIHMEFIDYMKDEKDIPLDRLGPRICCRLSGSGAFSGRCAGAGARGGKAGQPGQYVHLYI